MLTTFLLQIADFNIRLSSSLELLTEEGLKSFFCNDTKDIHIEIEAFAHTSTPPFECTEMVFEAAAEQQLFYRIYKCDNELGFLIYNQQNQEIQQYALLSQDLRSWKIWSHAVNATTIEPLRYPMLPIIMHYMTVKYNAVMMHASCVFDGSKGRMFSGFSGAGKSTISNIWAQSGATLINDDRLIIREDKDGNFWVYNTPMYYSDLPKKAPLTDIYLIRHSKTNNANKLTGAMAVSRVMAFSIQNNYDKYFIQNRLDLFSRICDRVAVNELGFLPNESVINYLKDYESR